MSRRIGHFIGNAAVFLSFVALCVLAVCLVIFALWVVGP